MRQARSEFAHDNPERTAVLLINLGTPDAPTTSAVRRYLAEFLSDRRVIEQPRWLWKLILHGIILRIRPPRVAKNYAKVWMPGGSPLLEYSSRLTRALAQKLDGRMDVRLAMTYGNPSIASVVDELVANDTRRLLVLPMYPQYSATTTGAVFDAVGAKLGQVRFLPEYRFVQHYCDSPQYINALAESIRAYWKQHGRADKLMFSYHGLPERYFRSGDPYPCQCRKTTRLVVEALGLSADEFELTFQSRFGREPWLSPYTDKRLEALPGEGASHVQVVCPGFAVDCLETLEEIAIQNRELFLGAGGTALDYIPALNDSDEHVAMLEALVAQHTGGWTDEPTPTLPVRQQLAMAAGAEQ